MKGKWKVTSQCIGEEKQYAVYRVIDMDKVQHSGNMELVTGYTTDKEEMESLARELTMKLKCRGETSYAIERLVINHE